MQISIWYSDSQRTIHVFVSPDQRRDSHSTAVISLSGPSLVADSTPVCTNLPAVTHVFFPCQRRTSAVQCSVHWLHIQCVNIYILKPTIGKINRVAEQAENLDVDFLAAQSHVERKTKFSEKVQRKYVLWMTGRPMTMYHNEWAKRLADNVRSWVCNV